MCALISPVFLCAGAMTRNRLLRSVKRIAKAEEENRKEGCVAEVVVVARDELGQTLLKAGVLAHGFAPDRSRLCGSWEGGRGSGPCKTCAIPRLLQASTTKVNAINENIPARMKAHSRSLASVIGRARLAERYQNHNFFHTFTS